MRRVAFISYPKIETSKKYGFQFFKHLFFLCHKKRFNSLRPKDKINILTTKYLFSCWFLHSICVIEPTIMYIAYAAKS